MPPASSNEPQSGAPLWAKWLIGLAIVAVLTAGVSLYYTLRPPPTEPEAGPSSPVPSQTEPARQKDSGIGVVTGCFVGPQDSTQALLAAQQKAPHTTAGAVEVAGQFVKWARQSPLPTVGGAEKVDAQIVSGSADDSVGSLADKTATSRSNEKPFSTSFEQGYYFVLEQSPDEVMVSISGAAMRAGNETPVASVYSTLRMVWEDGAWRLAGVQTVQSARQIVDSGTPFVGGC